MADILIYRCSADQLGKPFTIAELFHHVILRNTGLTSSFVDIATLHEKLTPDVQLFILPGAAASATYREQLSGARRELLHQRVSQDGMQVLGICAGAYVLCESFDYTFYDEKTGEKTERRVIAPELAMAKGRASGPDIRLHMPREYNGAVRWSGYDAVDVAYSKSNGDQLQVSLALGNGPWFKPGSNTSPLAHYQATSNAAMINFSYGKGGGILSGPSPEVGGHLLYYPTPKTLALHPHLAPTLYKIRKSRHTWAEMWGDMLPRLLPRATPEQHAQMAENLRSHAVKPLPRRVMAGKCFA